MLGRRDRALAEPTLEGSSALAGALAGAIEYFGLGPWRGKLQESAAVDHGRHLAAV